MAAHRPNLTRGAIELGFIILALVCGRMDASWPIVVGVGLGAAAYWAWSRRGALARMTPNARYAQGAIAIVFLLVVLGLAYGGGLLWRAAA